MSVSEKVKCINGNEKELSISRQCELLQLRRSSYYGHRDCHIEDEGLSEPQRFPVNSKLSGMNFIILSRTTCLENARAIASMILKECPACSREEAIYYANPKAEEALPASCSGSQLI